MYFGTAAGRLRMRGMISYGAPAGGQRGPGAGVMTEEIKLGGLAGGPSFPISQIPACAGMTVEVEAPSWKRGYLPETRRAPAFRR